MRSTTTDSGRIFRSSSRVRAAVALALVIAIVASLGTGVVEAQGRRGRDFQRWPVITIDTPVTPSVAFRAASASSLILV